MDKEIMKNTILGVGSIIGFILIMIITSSNKTKPVDRVERVYVNGKTYLIYKGNHSDVLLNPCQ